MDTVKIKRVKTNLKNMTEEEVKLHKQMKRKEFNDRFRNKDEAREQKIKDKLQKYYNTEVGKKAILDFIKNI